MKAQEREKAIDKMSLAFEAARSLIAGVKIIMVSDGIQEDGIKKHPTIPVIVCSALAIEIQIKALLDNYNIMRPKGDGHDLKVLFDALPITLQQQLLEHQISYTELSVEQARSALYEEQNAFKSWRYCYEKIRLETKPSFLFEFSLATSDFINNNFTIIRTSNCWLKENI